MFPLAIHCHTHNHAPPPIPLCVIQVKDFVAKQHPTTKDAKHKNIKYISRKHKACNYVRWSQVMNELVLRSRHAINDKKKPDCTTCGFLGFLFVNQASCWCFSDWLFSHCHIAWWVCIGHVYTNPVWSTQEPQIASLHMISWTVLSSRTVMWRLSFLDVWVGGWGESCCLEAVVGGFHMV